MIKTFKHKALQKFFTIGQAKGLPSKHIPKLRLLLAQLEVSIEPQDMQLPGVDLHKLSGNLKGYYAVKVDSHWRLTFKFESGNVWDVNYLDYH